MTLIVGSVNVPSAGSEVVVPISSDVPISGAQFILGFDVARLQYVEKVSGGVVNDSIGGTLRCSAGEAGELSQPFFEFRFLVHHEGELTLFGDNGSPPPGLPPLELLAVDTNLPPNQYVPEVVNGLVTIGEETMQVVFEVEAPNESQVVTDWKLYRTVDPDPQVGPVTEIESLSIDTLESSPVDLAAGSGKHYFFGEFINVVGPSGPGNVVEVDTDPSSVPSPPVMTYRIL